MYKGVLINVALNKIDAFNSTSPDNRDNCLFFLKLIKERFKQHNIAFDQPYNLEVGEIADFEIDFEVPRKHSKKTINKYLVRFECELIWPQSYEAKSLAQYKKVFSWNNKSCLTSQFVPVKIPNTMLQASNIGLNYRPKLCCMIAGNKALRHKSNIDLYLRRVDTIRWFETNAPDDFDLYGQGWNIPAARHGLVGKILNKLQKYKPNLTGKVFFPSYNGKVVSKLETLQKYRFSICYENVRELPGYITEKIFDSFFAGCVPVYWGAPDINRYIPEDCFIDRRKFANHEELYGFLISITETEFINYQDRIATFLNSDDAKLFSAEVFSDTIVSTIVSDLGIKN